MIGHKNQSQSHTYLRKTINKNIVIYKSAYLVFIRKRKDMK